MTLHQPISDTEIVEVLRARGIQPTSQRMIIARVLFTEMTHLSADDVFRLVNAQDRHVSKATVYNTLGLFTEKGVVREVIADPTRVFYDPNTAPHHHFYNVDTGVLTDIETKDVEVSGLPALPAGARLEGVDVVIRLRSAH